MTTSILESGGITTSSPSADKNSDDEDARDDRSKFHLYKAVEDFEANLRRAFNNEGKRLRNLHGGNKDELIRFDDVAYSKDDIYILLTKRVIQERPEFRLKDLRVDLEAATVTLVISLGHVTTSCRMRTVNRSIFTKARTTSDNNFHVSVTGLVIGGKLGLTRSEDNFRIKNVHLEYKYDSCSCTEFRGKSDAERTEFATKTTTKTPIASEVLATHGGNGDDDFTPAELILPDLIRQFDELLKMQLKVVEEFSLSETFFEGKEDELSKFDEQIWLPTTTRANYLLDNLLNTVHLSGVFRQNTLHTEFCLPYQENLSARTLRAKGIITGLSTLSRYEDWSMSWYTNASIVHCTGHLKMKKLQFIYDFSTEYGSSFMSGMTNAEMRDCLFSLSFRFDETNGTFSDFNVQVRKLNDIDYEFYNLGCLTRLGDELKKVMRGHILVQVHGTVKEFLETSLNRINR